MNLYKILIIILLLFISNKSMSAQSTSLVDDQKNVELYDIITKYQKLKHEDSIKFASLEHQLKELKDSIINHKTAYDTSSLSDSIKKEEINSRIEVLKEKAIGQAVVIDKDTLFLVFTKRGDSSPKERAASITAKIILVSENDLFNIDSLVINESLN